MYGLQRLRLLQRGRAQLSAEGDWNVWNQAADHAVLQRGRAQLSAEGRSLLIVVSFISSLQRGRAQLSAEG